MPHCVFPKSKDTILLSQGPPTPGPRTTTSPRPVRSRAAQQEVSSGRASEASSAAPHRSHSPPLAPHRCLWKNCLPRNRSLVPKRLRTAVLNDHSTTIKIRKLIMIQVYHLIHRLHSNFIECPNEVLHKFRIISCIWMSCLFHLLQTETVSQSFLIFHDLDIF